MATPAIKLAPARPPTADPTPLNRDLPAADRLRLRRKIAAAVRPPVGTSDLLGLPLAQEIIGVAGGRDVVGHDCIGMTSLALKGGEAVRRS